MAVIVLIVILAVVLGLIVGCGHKSLAQEIREKEAERRALYPSA